MDILAEDLADRLVLTLPNQCLTVHNPSEIDFKLTLLQNHFTALNTVMTWPLDDFLGWSVTKLPSGYL
jgi:hypothetical protein